MANIFFTGDLHMGHGNICKYARRPQLRDGDLDSLGNWVSNEIKDKRAQQMNEFLIAKWNSRVQPGDTVYHLGDFCCKGNERGVAGVRTKAVEWQSRLNGTIVHILGNHDANNGLARGLDRAVITAGGMSMLLLHNPAHITFHDCRMYDAVLCGHVHAAWKETEILRDSWDTSDPGKILAVNVGVDARKYAPVKLDEVIGIITRKRNE